MVADLADLAKRPLGVPPSTIAPPQTGRGTPTPGREGFAAMAKLEPKLQLEPKWSTLRSAGHSACARTRTSPGLLSTFAATHAENCTSALAFGVFVGRAPFRNVHPFP